MIFWDTSALLAVAVREAWTDECLRVLTEDREVAFWWTSPIECHSALWRRHREGTLSADEVRVVQDQVDRLLAGFHALPAAI